MIVFYSRRYVEGGMVQIMVFTGWVWATLGATYSGNVLGSNREGYGTAA